MFQFNNLSSLDSHFILVDTIVSGNKRQALG